MTPTSAILVIAAIGSVATGAFLAGRREWQTVAVMLAAIAGVTIIAVFA